MNKISFVLGGLAGYILGARAGRERFDQIRDLGTRAWEDPRVQEGRAKVEETVREQVPVLKNKAADVKDTASAKAADVKDTAAAKVSDAKDAATDKIKGNDNKGTVNNGNLNAGTATYDANKGGQNTTLPTPPKA